MHRIQCSQVWGGIKNEDVDVSTRCVSASLYSSAADGGKGGDIYYLSVCGHEHLTRVAVADVLGHGQAVSDISEWLYEALSERMDDPDNAAILSKLNRLAQQRNFDAITTATIVGFVRADNRTLLYSNAGHPPVLLKRAGEARWQPVRFDPESQDAPANLPLGVTEQAVYQMNSLPLASGDRAIFYTDGVLEAPRADGDLFGQERLLATLNQTNGELIGVKRAVLDALRAYTGGDLSHDDVTLLAVEVN